MVRVLRTILVGSVCIIGRAVASRPSLPGCSLLSKELPKEPVRAATYLKGQKQRWLRLRVRLNFVVRDYQGRRHTVTVAPEGYDWEGQPFGRRIRCAASSPGWCVRKCILGHV